MNFNEASTSSELGPLRVPKYRLGHGARGGACMARWRSGGAEMASAIGSARSQLRAFLWQQQHSVASFTQQIRSMAASTPPGVPPEFAHLSFVAPAQAVADHKAGSTTIIDVRRDDVSLV